MTSKFNIGDEIFFMDYSSPKKETIKGISFTIGEFGKTIGKSPDLENPLITYSLSEYTTVEESKAFATKEELQNNLFSKL